MRQAFSAKDPAEKIVLGLDFAGLLEAGETIVSAVWTVDRVDGFKGDGPSMLLGSIDITHVPVVSHAIQGGVAGSCYLHRAEATTSKARILVVSATQEVVLGGA